MGFEMTKTIKMLCNIKNHSDFWHRYHYWLFQDVVGTCIYCPYYVNENALSHWECAEYLEIKRALK